MRWPCTAIEIVDGRPRRAQPARWVYGLESIATRIAVVLWTQRGDWTDDVVLGLPSLSWGLPSTPAVEIEGITRLQVQRVAGVVRVREVVVRRPGSELRIGVLCDVLDDVAGSETGLLVGDVADIWQGYQPGAWYTAVQVGVRPVRLGTP